MNAAKYLYAIVPASLVLLAGCYGINEEVPSIELLNTDCLKSNAWDEIVERYSPVAIVDSTFMVKADMLREMPFYTNVLYFSEDPQELVGMSPNFYFIKYVYNPQISSDIVDGLSPEMTEKERERIQNRIQRLLIPYQCEEGQMRSLGLMNR